MFIISIILFFHIFHFLPCWVWVCVSCLVCKVVCALYIQFYICVSTCLSVSFPFFCCRHFFFLRFICGGGKRLACVIFVMPLSHIFEQVTWAFWNNPDIQGMRCLRQRIMMARRWTTLEHTGQVYIWRICVCVAHEFCTLRIMMVRFVLKKKCSASRLWADTADC